MTSARWSHLRDTSLRRALSIALAGAAAVVEIGCSSGTRPTTQVAAAPSAVISTGRPIPYPIDESPAFKRAVERGTRTRTGEPGPRNWTQHARYALRAELDPQTKRLTGEGRVRYQNRSPDTLKLVPVHLYQNMFAPSSPRNVISPTTSGMELTRVVAQGRPLPQM